MLFTMASVINLIIEMLRENNEILKCGCGCRVLVFDSRGRSSSRAAAAAVAAAAGRHTEVAEERYWLSAGSIFLLGVVRGA